MPTLPGNTWIYQHESRSGANAKLERWMTEETLTKLMTVPEGILVVRRIRVLDGKPSVAPPKEQAWLLHGDCLYDLAPGDWDARLPNTLSAKFSAMPPWKGGEHVRVFCFPLVDNKTEGKTWGKESGHEWRVADVNNQDPSSPDQGKTFHVSSYNGSELTEDVWFERGVGIVKEIEVHVGTNEESRTQLLYFEPAPKGSIGKAPVPVAEVGLNYANNSLSTSTSGESNQSGGSVYGEYFFKQAAEGWRQRSMFGIAAEFNGSGSGSGNLYTYLAGPRLDMQLSRALTYFAEPFIGAAHVRVNGITPSGTADTAARSSLVYGFAIGVDLVTGQRYVVTLFRLDSLSLEVPEPVSGSSRWRDDLRISSGIGFRFGQR